MSLQISLPALCGALLCVVVGCDEESRQEPEPCETYCPPSTGFPCPCTAESGCYDGSWCSGISPSDETGFCARPCTTAADCEHDLDCSAEAQCVLTTPQGKGCALVCEGDHECPWNMACTPAGNGKLCYPSPELAGPDAG